MHPLYKSGDSYASSNGNNGYYVSKVANPAQVLY
jgi:hypothetical protein